MNLDKINQKAFNKEGWVISYSGEYRVEKIDDVENWSEEFIPKKLDSDEKAKELAIIEGFRFEDASDSYKVTGYTKEYFIEKRRFLAWYFESGQDSENESIREDIANEVINKLMKDGTVTMTVEDFFEKSNHEAVKAYYVEGWDEEDEIELGDLGINFTLKLK